MAIAVGYWLFRVMFPDDADVIRSRLVQMAADASFESTEGQITKISKAGKLAGYFAVDAEISVKPWGYHQVNVSGRTEIRQAAVGARSTVAWLTINVDRIEVNVADDRESAVATLSLTARSSRGDDPWSERMDVQMRRVDGDWLISRVANRPILK